ncbi:DUF4956 domain-containing protein [Niameybacter sp.]|uniref:DUF4956 domain-containing protein n=1 Tax=Niameybacter sp. TaxID=2033640 RepID=UPI002FCA8BA8
MREYLSNVLEGGQVLSIEEVLGNILIATVIGLVIYLSYWITHVGSVYSKKFNVSLVMLTLLTATVMIIIESNVALSLGMVGALSIVRYRTAIKDSRDTAYIFWAIIVGICCGTGGYIIAAIGTGAVFILLLLLGRVKNDNRMLLVIRGTREKSMEIEAIVFKVFENKAKLRVKNSTESSIEFIYEISKQSYDKSHKHTPDLLGHVYALGGIEYVNIVVQNDEIV